jgi:2'-5' RNA ligase
MTTSTYHLWLKPSGAVHELLARTIRELARNFDAPVFEPHVTLLGHLAGTEDAHIQRTQQLARRMKPIHIVLTEPAGGQDYFQCVFLRVSQTPDVMNANALARQIFDSEQESYMPHLSLVYGRYPDARRSAIIGSVPRAVLTSFEAVSLFLIRADSENPQHWHEIAVVPIQ